MPSTKKSAAASASSNNKVTKSTTPSRSTMPRKGSPVPVEKSNGKTHKRSRSGCFTCRLRRKKCDEAHPVCGACVNLSVRCEYKRPVWWGNAEERRIQKEHIKNKIKQTKMLERSNTHNDSFHNRNQRLPSPPMGPFELDFNRPMYAESYDMFSSHLPTPGLGVGPYGPYAPQYEIDVKTEWHTFVNDVPMRHDTSTSTFSSFNHPQLDAPLPAFTGDECFGDFSQAFTSQSINPGTIDPRITQSFPALQSIIPVGFQEQQLHDYFIMNLLPQVFPVLETRQMGYVATQAMFNSLSYNLSYLHCCLSVAASHLKATQGLVGDQIDKQIVYHRWVSIRELRDALKANENLDQVLDTALAMIFLHCSVSPSEDEPRENPSDHEPRNILSDDKRRHVPWTGHFKAATGLIAPSFAPFEEAKSPAEINERERKDPDFAASLQAPPFNVTLTSWIDILGSTMMGTRPRFAKTYNRKLHCGKPCGLRELMGCDDRIMYIISEIACLESAKHNPPTDNSEVCEMIENLDRQLDQTEPADPKLERPYYPSTAIINPEALTKIISRIFRIAARIYLCSLVPGFDRHAPSTATIIQGLVRAVTEALCYIPPGPDGFDRSLVWPLFMVGVFSTPNSKFREDLAARKQRMGEHANLGSFGRMYKLLNEVWAANDGPVKAHGSSRDDHISSLTSPISRLEKPELPTRAEFTLGGQVIKPQEVHWRTVMSKKDWHFLLI